MVLKKSASFFIGFLTAVPFLFSTAPAAEIREDGAMSYSGRETIKLFLCGDVMTGRGIDQVLPNSVDPQIFEPYMTSAAGYVELAEYASGPIPQPVSWSYIWGDALSVFERERPDLRLINLETSITRSDDYWKGKGINYRMHPDNVACLTAASIDGCALANNHVLDWGFPGLQETLATLHKEGIKTAGAGSNSVQAESPAMFEVNGKRKVWFLSFGSESSGIPQSWAATEKRPGVNLLKDFSDETVKIIAEKVRQIKGGKDVVVASIHWGGNWGYHVPRSERAFAYRLIDEAGVDMIFGHSSHHPKGIEVYKGKLILFGCGDFLNDYEGISGYEEFRAALTLMYFAEVDSTSGRLLRLLMSPMRMQKFRLNRTTREETLWLRDTLNREGKKLGTRVEPTEDGRLVLHWD